MTASPQDLPEEPNWGLLPGRAMQFFGLEAGYDKKDLKRAYNRWIRRYKPEQCPEEFQRIRAGYERLEEALRFGSIDSERGFLGPDSNLIFREESPSPAERGSSPPEPADLADSPPEPAARVDLAALVREHSLEELTRKLRDKVNKSAREWTLLALASEEAPDAPEDGSTFMSVILEAFAERPSDPVLTQLLFDLLREKPPTDRAEEILRRLLPNSGQSSLTARSYFAFTSPLWEDFLREQPFPLFSKTLRECRETLGEASDPAYFPLLLRLVRLGAFKADEEWMEDALGLLDETYHSMPPPMQEEMDQFDFLEQYRRRRGEFLNGPPIRKKIDFVLRKITTGPEVEADRAFLALQTYLIDHRDEALEVFPLGPEDSFHVLHPLLVYASEVQARHSDEPLTWEKAVAYRRVVEMLYRIEHRTRRTLLGRLFNGAQLLYLLTCAVLLLALPLSGVFSFVKRYDHSPGHYYVAMGFGILLSLALFGFGIFYGLKLIKKRVLAKQLYQRVWRPEVVDFLVTTLLPISILRRAMSELEDDALRLVPALAVELDEDASLEVLSLALEFAE